MSNVYILVSHFYRLGLDAKGMEHEMEILNKLEEFVEENYSNLIFE